MNTIIDAQVFKGYYEELITGQVSTYLTCSPTPLFIRLNKKEDTAYVDEGGNLQYEWCNLVDRDWFQVWFADMLINGSIIVVDTTDCHHLKKKLCQIGFPNSRDFWYIKVAVTISTTKNEAYLISEDLDFYSPKEKKCDSKRRQEILGKCLGDIPKIMRDHRVFIKPIDTFLQFIPTPPSPDINDAETQ